MAFAPSIHLCACTYTHTHTHTHTHTASEKRSLVFSRFAKLRRYMSEVTVTLTLQVENMVRKRAEARKAAPRH